MGTNNIIDIDLSATRKKKIRVDGDDNRILELDTSDMNIVVRWRDGYEKLESLMKEINDLQISDTGDIKTDITELGNVVEDIDTKMRNVLDEIFDSNVSEICAPSGSMYDMFNGEYRFEHILKALTPLYENNIDKEYEKMKKRVQKHTDKYVKK